MEIKKIGKLVYGAKLSAAEKKAMDLEIKRQIADFDRQNELEISSIVLWYLHEYEGWGPKRLRRFYEGLLPAIERLAKDYEMGDKEGDRLFLCTFKLKDYGIDIEKWNEEIKNGK